MVQYDFPTIILSGVGSLKEFAKRLKGKKHEKILIVTDGRLVEIGLIQELSSLLASEGIGFDLFSDVHPNPVEEDIEIGLQAYISGGCDSIIGFGGGSPIDAAKVIKLMAANPPPLKQYEDRLGGSELVKGPMPALYAIPTTAGTGSEVGRSGVIISKETGQKTIFFHPEFMPHIAVLDPELTVGLPPHLTAATGVDALVHCIEAYLATGFHPMADGIALQGIELALEWLPRAVADGSDLRARERMQLAAAMGATAFQKGLGIVHSLAHPLSSMCATHHGLANALMLPETMKYLEQGSHSRQNTARISKILSIFEERKIAGSGLAESCKDFIMSLGIEMGLAKHGVEEADTKQLSRCAFLDTCHVSSMAAVSESILLDIYTSSL